MIYLTLPPPLEGVEVANGGDGVEGEPPSVCSVEGSFCGFDTSFTPRDLGGCFFELSSHCPQLSSSGGGLVEGGEECSGRDRGWGGGGGGGGS